MKNLILGLGLCAMLCFSCSTSHKVSKVMGVSNMVKISKDTVSASLLQTMIENREIPNLNKCAVSNLRNVEDNTKYKFYTYYNDKTHKLYTIKELQPNTTYVVEIKKVD